MLLLHSLLTTLLLALTSSPFTQAAPQQRNRGGGGGGGGGRNRNGGNNNNRVTQTPQQQASATPQGISLATDNTSTILDTTVRVSSVPVRVKISAPAALFQPASNVPGAASLSKRQNQNLPGLHVLLHGDGGQSFFDFPNQDPRNTNLLGVTILAPSENLLWGTRAGPPAGLTRVDGEADALLVRDLVKEILPQLVSFDPSNVFFSGVSGGALLLSGFFMPAHLSEFSAQAAGGGVLLMCGAMPPQVDVVGGAAFATARIHYQTTRNELALLQEAIPAAIRAYEDIAATEGIGAGEVGVLQTVDGTPNGGHCEFDEQGFVSGIQLVVDSFGEIMLPGASGVVQGIDAVTVLTPVVGNEDVEFVGANANAVGRRGDDDLMI